MKFFFISLSILLSVIFGLYKSIYKPRPFLLKLFSALAVTASILIAVLPPVYYEIDTLYMLNKTGNFTTGDVAIENLDTYPNYYNESKQALEIFIYKDTLKLHFSKSPSKLHNSIINVSKNSNSELIVNSIKENNSFIYYPYIPALGNFVKMFGVHVPLAWVSVLGFLFTLIFSIKYLIKKEIIDDVIVRASAKLGTFFCIGATITGMIWAKETWGSYWNWDPRETSIFILLLVYFAYFILRSSIENETVKRNVSAAYAIIASVSMPFFIFVLPRISSGLHPGSADDSFGGPIISTGKSMLDSSLLFSFSSSMFAFSLAFFILLSVLVRKYLKEEESE